MEEATEKTKEHVSDDDTVVKVKKIISQFNEGSK